MDARRQVRGRLEQQRLGRQLRRERQLERFVPSGRVEYVDARDAAGNGEARADEQRSCRWPVFQVLLPAIRAVPPIVRAQQVVERGEVDVRVVGRRPSHDRRADVVVAPIGSCLGRLSRKRLQKRLPADPTKRRSPYTSGSVGRIPTSNSQAGSPEASSSAIIRPSAAGTYTRVPATAGLCSTAPVSRLHIFVPSRT